MTTYALLPPHPLDTALPDAVAAVAAMIGTVLAPYGVRQSVPAPAGAVDVGPESGVFVEHSAMAGTVAPSSECADDVLAVLHSDYYVRAIGSDPDTAIAETLALIIPAVRAHRAYIEHAVDGLNVQCRLTAFSAGILTRGTGDTAQQYY